MHRFGSGQAFLDFVWGEDDGDLDLEGVDAGPASLPFELDSMQIDESGEATEFEEESEEKEEKEPAAAQSSPPAPLAFARLAQPAVASNCCTICEEEMSYLKSFELSCGHRHCHSCLKSHVKVQIEKAAKFVHSVSWLEHDGFALCLRSEQKEGALCPSYMCNGILPFHRVEELLEAEETDLLEALSDIVAHQSLSLQELRRRIQEEIQEKRFNLFLGRNPSLCRLCPHCYAIVEKNGGCNHMFCIRCQQPFLWSRAKSTRQRKTNNVPQNIRTFKRMRPQQ